MFRPELKDTGWDTVPEVVFEITGDKYDESHFDIIKYEYERPDGSKIMLSEPNFNYTIPEKRMSTIINDSLMGVLWDSITITELENHFADAIVSSDFDVIRFRLEIPGDYSYAIERSDYIYGWIHYKENNKINTFRFQIGLDGSFKKC